MAQILVQGLAKTYRVAERDPGVASGRGCLGLGRQSAAAATAGDAHAQALSRPDGHRRWGRRLRPLSPCRGGDVAARW